MPSSISERAALPLAVAVLIAGAACTQPRHAHLDGATEGTPGAEASAGAGGGAVSDFPLNPILDSFSGADGPPVSDHWWIDSTDATGTAWTVKNEHLVSSGEKPRRMEWHGDPFGPKQEAFMTLVEVPPRGSVYLLFQCGTGCDCAFVSYREGVLHFGYEDETASCGARDLVTAEPLALVDRSEGNQLGVRTRADRMVEVYVNRKLWKTYDLGRWTHAGREGWIGFRADLTGAATVSVKLDDFGGGVLP